MTSVKLKFHSTSKTQEGVIYYQVIHQRIARQIKTAYMIMPQEWDSRSNNISAKVSPERSIYILTLKKKIAYDMERFSFIVDKFSKRTLNFTAEDIVCEFCRYLNEFSLFNYFKIKIETLKVSDRRRTAEAYYAAFVSFYKFRSGTDIPLDHFTKDTAEAYQVWLRKRGLVMNTVSFYNRILRALYRKAVSDEIILDRNPFARVYTGVDKTVHRALSLNTLKRLRSYNIDDPGLAYARDMFMMSFYLRGMSFIDMAYLRKSDLKGGYVSYRRRKTGQLLSIRWTSEMQSVIDRYPTETEFLLPIFKCTNGDLFRRYRNESYNINHKLKRVAGLVGIRIPLTLYVARHSWATAAKSQGIPLSVISEGMGHDSETTTQIYLASLDSSAVDRANMMVIRRVLGS